MRSDTLPYSVTTVHWLPNLQDCESIFHAFVNNSLAAGWITDESGCLWFINKLAREIWHIDENYQLKHGYSVFPQSIADEFLASDKKVLETGQPTAFVVSSIRKNGSPGYYMLHKYLLPIESTTRLVVGQAIDITDEIHVREELRKSNERFSYVARAVWDCIWGWDIASGQV